MRSVALFVALCCLVAASADPRPLSWPSRLQARRALSCNEAIAAVAGCVSNSTADFPLSGGQSGPAGPLDGCCGPFNTAISSCAHSFDAALAAFMAADNQIPYNALFELLGLAGSCAREWQSLAPVSRARLPAARVLIPGVCLQCVSGPDTSLGECKDVQASTTFCFAAAENGLMSATQCCDVLSGLPPACLGQLEIEALMSKLQGLVTVTGCPGAWVGRENSTLR